MRKWSFDFGDFEITFREILASISIIAVMLTIGFLIAEKISQRYVDINEIYNKALKIENDEDVFQHGMDTNIGNAFIHGELKAIDTVTFSEIDGKYMYVKKVEEHYNMHTRTYTTTDGKGHTRIHTQTYWSWDYAGKETKKCKKLSFCGVKFKSEKINIPRASYIQTIKKSSHVRFKYYGVEMKYTGTIFAELKDGTIPDDSCFYENKSIDETMDELVSNGKVAQIIFWVIWTILIIGVIFGFYYLDNEWLE